MSQLPAALTPAVFVLTRGKLGLWRHSENFLGRMLVGKGVSVGILDFLFTYLPVFSSKYWQHEHCMEPFLVCRENWVATSFSCYHHTLRLSKTRRGSPTGWLPATGLQISTKQELTPQKLKASMKQVKFKRLVHELTCIYPNILKFPHPSVLSFVTASGFKSHCNLQPNKQLYMDFELKHSKEKGGDNFA